MSNIDDDHNNNEKSHSEILSSINEKLDKISSKIINFEFIFRIDNRLRETSKAAYEPEMVSIGPYHNGKNKLQKMEKYKWEYLLGILVRGPETNAGKYIDSLLEEEEHARSCYAEHVTLNREEFVEMMLLDGCFIIEFLRKYKKRKDRHGPDDDPIFKMEWISEIIRRDLLLFENQIPFFILEKLFDMTKISRNNPTGAAADDDVDLISLAVSCLNDVITTSENKSQPEVILHLLDLMYVSWCSPFAKLKYSELVQIGSISNGNSNCPPGFSCINFERKNRDNIMFIKSVTELKQDGINFVKATESTSWLDIKFKDGEIKIPPLVIQDGTESILRNLIAYEQYMFDLGFSGKFVTDYATFIDCLINTPMDVQKLRVEGIIKNLLGCDEEITHMFNKIGKNIFISTSDFSYQEHFKNVKEYCNHRRNKWISDLKKTHFENPWLFISFFAAALALILTIIQTVLSFLEHFKKDPKVVCSCK